MQNRNASSAKHDAVNTTTDRTATALTTIACGGGAIVLLATIVTIGYLAWGACLWSIPLPDRPFDVQLWQQAGRCSNLRARMIADLVETHDLVGISAEEAKMLLGEPAFAYPSGEMMYYHVGPAVGVDANWLHLYIEHGTVYDYKIYNH